MMLVRDLLEEIPPDTMVDVARACDAWNLRIRRQITDQFLRFGLQYRRGDRNLNASLSPSWDKVGHPVRLDLPDVISDRPIPPGFELAARLSVYSPAARSLGSAASTLTRLFEPQREKIWLRTQVSPGMARGTLQGAISLSEELQRLATPLITPTGEQRFDLVRFLLEVDEDVLGVYQYDPSDDSRAANPTGSILIYWGAIGLVASTLGVSSSHLAVVVLAHELAHGYSHLGHDRDGRRWSGAHFRQSEHLLKESIAQYYTHLVVEALDASLPGVLMAYERLLPKQPRSYQGHLPWLLNFSPERVASVLAEVRSQPAGYDDVSRRLGSGKFQSVDAETALAELTRRRRGDRA